MFPFLGLHPLRSSVGSLRRSGICQLALPTSPIAESFSHFPPSPQLPNLSQWDLRNGGIINCTEQFPPFDRISLILAFLFSSLTRISIGGRTAWSSTVAIQGSSYSARYWYDGQYLNNAKEDAAEVALMGLNSQSRPPTAQPGQLYAQQNNGQGSSGWR